jgi:hypothetical protein
VINLLLSIVGPALEEDVAAGFARFAQWIILSERDGRMLIDAIGEEQAIGAAFSALDYLGRDPIAIAGWREDGSLVETIPFREAEWLRMAPDSFVAGDGEDFIPVRPSSWRDLHRWSGWPEKQPPA